MQMDLLLQIKGSDDGNGSCPELTDGEESDDGNDDMPGLTDGESDESFGDVNLMEDENMFFVSVFSYIDGIYLL